MFPCVLSQNIVKYLHEIKGFSIEEIAHIASMSKKEIQNITIGIRTFSLKNIESLIKNQDTPIIEILAESCDESQLPEPLKEKVIFYKHVQDVKKKKNR